MSDPYLGEIRVLSFGFPPKGWALCNGQLLPISQNQALFALLGTTYGGDGITTFALPDLRGRLPMHLSPGTGFAAGQAGGEATHTLTVNELPAHQHVPRAASTASSSSPAGAVWAAGPSPSYRTSFDTQLATDSVATAGGSQPHENRPPYLTLSFVIALVGIFPSRA